MEINTKKLLLEACRDFVSKRMEACRKAMDAAQESANEETKSSAGDKYETGRAMAQMERDKNAFQLSEALKLKQILDQIQAEEVKDRVGLGALVFSTAGKFFISISAGKIMVDGEEYFAVSVNAPIGKVLLERAEGEEVDLNGRRIKILKVY